MPPAGPRHVGPPLQVSDTTAITERHRPRRRREHNRSGYQALRRCPGKVFGLWCPLGDGHIPGGRNEYGKLAVGDFRRIHPKPSDPDSMDRSRVLHRVGAAMGHPARITAAQRKLAAGYPDHPQWLILQRLGIV